MRNRTKFTLSIIALALSTSSALAQEDDTGFFAKADTTIAHDDNIYRVTDDLAQSDTYLSLTPELKLIGGVGKHRFLLSYTGDYAKFSEASDADYNDHSVTGRLDFEHSLKFSTKFEAGFQKEHEDPGSINRIQLDITEYNKFDLKYALAGFSYGQVNAIGRFSFDVRHTDKDHTNNNLDYLDFVSQQYTSRFSYRIAPKTRLYVEAIISEFDYEPGQNFELDNSYKRYRAGVIWDLTNKLTGNINFGYQDRDYDQEGLRDIDGLAYNGQVFWAINSYTSISVGARRESIDSSIEQTGGFLRTSYHFNVSHELTELWNISFDYGRSEDELVFTTARNDNREAYRAELGYQIKRYINLGISYEHDNRDSTSELADFESNKIGMSIIIELDN